jgi:predicted nucleic acid-binding protein
MLIVSDTSPLNILVQIGHVDVLPKLFKEVAIPHEVAREMAHLNAPDAVRAFVASPPTWLSVRAPQTLLPLSSLGPGEMAAISLALELRAPLLIDERAGRHIALKSGVAVVGAIGVLERAADRGMINDLAAVHDAIRAKPFHIAEAILTASLARHRSQRKTTPKDP